VVTIFATPPVAEIFVDNVSVGEGPFTAKYKRGTRHVVHASAPGYVTKSETIEVTATTSMNLMLEKEAGAPPPPVFVRPQAPRPQAPPPPQPASAPPPSSSPAPSAAPAASVGGASSASAPQ
jgi:hypothetical protein